MIAPAERVAGEGHEPLIVRAEPELDPDPLVVRLGAGLLLVVLLPLFALTFLASIALALVLLPLVQPYAFIRRPRGALPHEARAAPSHPGGRRDIPRA